MTVVNILCPLVFTSLLFGAMMPYAFCGIDDEVCG